MAALKTQMEEALNKHINEEIYSSYLYLSMAAYFESSNFTGFSNWMRIQAKEETLHYEKLFDYVLERGGRVKLMAVAEPPVDWDSALDVFRATLAHEQTVTEMINTLLELAIETRDRATQSFLQWFVDEQVEEEASAEQLMRMLEMSGDSPAALLMLDRETATRVYTPPVAAP